MRYEIQGSRVVSFTDGGNSHEGVIIDEHANGYALYVWHHDGKPRYRSVPFEQVDEHDGSSGTIELTELVIRYPEIVERVFQAPLIKAIPSEMRHTLVEAVLEQVDQLIKNGDIVRVSSLEGILRDIAKKSPEMDKQEPAIDPSVSVSAFPVQVWREINNVIHFRPKTMKWTSLSLQADTAIPRELAVITWDQFPIAFRRVSVAELLKVSKTIEEFVSNPYSLKVLWEFREIVYMKIYYLRTEAEREEDISYDFLDHYYGAEEGIDLDELGISGLSWYIPSGRYGDASHEETKKKDTLSRERIAQAILHPFDSLFTKAQNNPEFLKDKEFTAKLDVIIEALTRIIWDDEWTSSFGIGSLVEKRQPANKLARHVLPALWHKIQGTMRDVQLSEQRVFINWGIKTRQDQFMDVRTRHTVTDSQSALEMIRDLSGHYGTMERFFTITHTGLARGRSGRSAPRPLDGSELRDFRNSLFQFDRILQELTQGWSEWGDVLLLS